MKKIVLRNEFHNTETEVELLQNGHVSAHSIDQAAHRLCGMEDCSCVPVMLNGNSIVDTDGNLYEID